LVVTFQCRQPCFVSVQVSSSTSSRLPILDVQVSLRTVCTCSDVCL
jgi:hypothetical protein